MQLISKFNIGFSVSLFVIDIFSKYVWVIPLKDKKVITITNKSDRKPKKMWIDEGSKFYNRSMKWYLEKNWHRNVFNI